MNIPVVIFLTLAGLLVGYLFAALAGRLRTARLSERKNALEQELAGARATVERQRSEMQMLAEARAALEATLASERRSGEEKLRLVGEAGDALKTEFQALAASALQSSNASFLQLAKSTLQNYQTRASGELAQKEQAVKSLVEPISESLAKMNEQIQALETARSRAYGELSTQVGSLTETQRALQLETGNLVRALRDPQTRGRWGELQLRKVLELSGMLEYCDFEDQVTVIGEERKYRPDVVVSLPGAKHVVIDAKAPITAYLNSLEAKDDAERNACLKDHVRQVRQHIDSLAAKEYWAQFQPTPEFVVLFLPGEAFFRAALMADPQLLEYGDGKVILASPITLIAMLKTVAYGWNQKNLAESARKISDAGKLLYERLCTMTGHMQEVGKKLGGSVKAYNEMVSSMERRVFPVGRKLPDLDRSLMSEWLMEIEQLEKTPRELEAPDWQASDEDTAGPFAGEKADGAKI